MRRLVTRFLFVFILGSLAMVLGVLTSMTLTPPGRALLARTVSRMLDEIVIGQVKVGAISGSFLYDLTLEDLVVRDTSGALLADLPRVRVSYRLPNLLAGQVVLSGVQLDHPTIQLIKHRNGRMNYEEVLGLGKGKGGGPSPLIEFHDVKVNGGALRIALPWNPSKSLTTQSAAGLRAGRGACQAGQADRGGPRRPPQGDPPVRSHDADGPAPDRHSRSQALHHRPRFARHPRERPRGDAPRCGRPGLPPRRQRGVQPVPRRTPRHPLFRRRRGHLAARHRAVRFPGELAAGESRRPALGLARLPLDDGERRAGRAIGVRGAHRLRHPGTAPPRRQPAHRRRPGGAHRPEARPRLPRHEAHVRDLDLDAVRPYIDSLPFYGRLTGTVSGGGYLDAMDVSLDWAFADARVPGNPVSVVAGDGVVGASPDSGLTFSDFNLRRSNVDLRTVRLVAPAVILDGRLAAVGHPRRAAPQRRLRRNRAASGRRSPRQRGDRHAFTSIPGSIRSASPPTSRSIRSRSTESAAPFPSLAARGDLRGTFRSQGTLAHLEVEAALAGRARHGGRARRGDAAASPLGRREPSAALLPARSGGADGKAPADRSSTERSGSPAASTPSARPRRTSSSPSAGAGFANGSSTASSRAARCTTVSSAWTRRTSPGRAPGRWGRARSATARRTPARWRSRSSPTA